MALSKIQSSSLAPTAVTDKLGYSYTPVNKSGFGYKNYTDASTSQSIPTGSVQMTLGSTSFTIPATTGVSTWMVHALGSWTGAQGGHRVWTFMWLDNINSNQVTNNADGWPEHSWAESDISVAAYSWNQSATWINVAAGTHTVGINAYSNNASNTCWRRGISVFWIPMS